MRFDTGVHEGRILIAAEGEDRLIHVRGLEDAQVHEDMEVCHGQSSGGLE
ncbi:MAG: hypothetical protein M9950_10150 [Thermomicrobiales bacterium]|nr:hypothetical protein [Thermomicrobiales bacterium]